MTVDEASGEAAVGGRPKPKSRRRRRILITLGVVLVLFLGVSARFFVWPPLPDLPDRVDAIIELGGPTNRDAAALALARAGRATYLVQSTTEAEAESQRCLPPVTGVTIL